LTEAAEGETIRLSVAEDTGERLDAYIAARVSGLSRTRIAHLLEEGSIRLNGRIPKKSERPVAGDSIEIDVPAPTPSALEAEPIPLDIRYEDADLLVIDKPAGMVVHPSLGHAAGTLVNALLHHVGDLAGIGGVKRPGIVHRLDKDTSGLMLVAKTDAAHRGLSAALKRREIRRLYLTAAWGHLKAERQTVDAPIARSPSNRRRMAVVEGGRAAVTHFRRIERWRAADLIEARLETGRTHQIRVHLESIGHPVVADRDYGGGGERRAGGGPDRSWAREFAAMVPRQFLHAAELAFVHPLSGELLTMVSELPAELSGPAQWARRTSSG
jgi:23S rRNA pseudouridine1911/1915/1917 synthase